MTINKKLVATSALAIMMSLVLAPTVKAYAIDGSISGSSEESSEPVTGIVTEEESSTLDNLDDLDMENLTLDQVKEITRESLKSDETADCEVTFGEDFVNIDVAFDDMAMLADMVKEDSATYKETWDYIVDTMVATNEVYYNMYKKFGIDVNLYVFDKKDTEKIIIYCKNGQKVYDCVNDSDMDADMLYKARRK
jgi:hypothetical protein